MQRRRSLMEQTARKLAFRSDIVLPGGIRDSAICVLFLSVAMPVQRRCLKQELCMEHLIPSSETTPLLSKLTHRLKQSWTPMMELRSRILQRRQICVSRSTEELAIHRFHCTLTSALPARLRFLRSTRCAAVAGYAAHRPGGLKSGDSYLGSDEKILHVLALS
jgi:hypothetical protein